MSYFSDLYLRQSYKQPSLLSRKSPDLTGFTEFRGLEIRGKENKSVELPTPGCSPAIDASLL